MSIICSKCHRTKVSCEAIVSPNTKEFIYFTDGPFESKWCGECNREQSLVNPEEVKTDVDKAFNQYLTDFGKEPSYALCQIMYKDDGSFHDMLFKLSTDIGEDDDEIFFYCNGIKELKSLTEASSNDFILTKFNTFLKSWNYGN